jgi:DNA-binding Lrp family transcriptional regulator
MDRIEQQILRNLTLHPAGLAAQELRSTIRPQVSQPTLWRRLDRLRAMGRIRAIGRGRATRYVNQDSDHSIADMRSKTLHIAVGRKLIRNPRLVDDAQQRLLRMYQSAPYAKVYLDRWRELLAGPVENVLRVFGADDEESKALRHASPFAGILTEEERLMILREQGLIR